jgi:hypothetical protein
MFAKGKQVRLGHRVMIAQHVKGVVVFSIDTDEYSAEFPKSNWEYLGRGIMVQTENDGLVYLEKPFSDPDDLEIIG